MTSFPTKNGHSSEVRLHLLVGDRQFELASIGPERIRLRAPVELPPCEAEVVMQVDTQEHRWAIILPDGVSAGSREARTKPAAPLLR